MPESATPRQGVPQGRHLHALLGGGQRTLEELFPGFEQRLAAAGAVPYRAGLDIRVERPGFDPFPQRDLGWTGYAMSRPLVESIVRGFVGEQRNITLRTGCSVRDIIAAAHGSAATGVRFDDGSGRVETLPADLIVDASGREAPTLAFLEATAHALPAETSIGADLHYATAMFAVPADAPGDWKGVMTLPHPGTNNAGALLFPLEGQRWIVSVGCPHAGPVAADPDGFMSFVQRLRTPTIHNALRHSERLGDIARFAFPASVRRHFGRLSRFPRGLLPIADAICRFNPIYGQGMSVAAQQACALRGRELFDELKSEPFRRVLRPFVISNKSILACFTRSICERNGKHD